MIKHAFVLVSLILALTTYGQRRQSFDIEFYKKYVNYSYSGMAREFGWKEYKYSKLNNSIDPGLVKWLRIKATDTLDEKLARYKHVAFLELEVTDRSTFDLTFLEHLTGVEVMYLHVFNTRIPDELALLENLQLLKINNSRNQDFSGIKHLPRLKHLEITDFELSSIPVHLNSLDSLYHLGLSNITHKTNREKYGACSVVDWSALENNKSIEKVTLERCGLTSIPEELTTCSNLKNLDLNGNPLLDFTELGQLKTLEQLNLKHALLKIGKLPTELSQLDKLQNLNILQPWGKLNVDGIEEIKSLKHLECNPTISRETGLLPSGIYSLNNLESLHLLDIYSLSSLAGIEQLVKLKSLWIRGGAFKHFPKELGQLPNLVSLTFNPIYGLETCEGVNSLKQVEYLTLYLCHLKTFDFKSTDFQYLETLRLAGNPDCTVVGPVETLPKLKRLTCRKGALSTKAIETLKRKGVDIGHY